MLMEVYKEHKWLPWRFNFVPTGWWTNKANQAAFLEWFSTQNGFSGMEGWYNVTLNDIIDRGGAKVSKLD